MVTITNLKTEYKVNPLAIDCKNPRFFWQIKSNVKNVKQKSYRLCVATSIEKLYFDEPDMYDSGVVLSDETVGIEYAGKPLESKKDYYWCVESDCGSKGNFTSYDGYFRTGILQDDHFNAKWIENGELTPEDSPAHSGFLSKTVDNPLTPLKITVDLGEIKSFDCVVYYGLRIFERPGLADYPGFQFPRNYRIYVESNLNSNLDSNSYSEKIIIDDKTDINIPVANPGCQPVFVNFEKIKGRYITFEATNLQCYDQGKYSFGLSQIEVWNGSDLISEGCKAFADEGYEKGEGFGPDVITDGTPTWHKAGYAKPLPAPYFKKNFTIDYIPDNAYVYVSALGLYELYINGERVSEDFLAPEWTNYDKYVQYSCYEVSAFIKNGENEIFAITGDGWYAGRQGMANVFGPKKLRGIYGIKPKFILELDIIKGENVDIIGTDESWLSSSNTPIRANDIYDGEFYDARYEDSLEWKNAKLAEDEKTLNTRLVSFINEQIKCFDKITPISIKEPAKGVYVADFGTNVSGFCQITMHGEKNKKVILRHAGGLRANGLGYFANLRGAFALDTYIFKDSEKVTFRPHFTYHGFRYLEITGLDYMPESSDITCYAISSGFEEIGKIHFENVFYNWLLKACKQTIRSNLVGVVTDCNDRDERLPWLMEGLESQSYLFDGALFWERHIKELRDAWKEDGRWITQAPDALKMDLPKGTIPRTLIHIMLLEYGLYGNNRIAYENFDYLSTMEKYNREVAPYFVFGNRDYTDCDWLNTTKIMAETGLNKDMPQISDEMFATITNARFCRMMYFISMNIGKKKEAFDYLERYSSGIFEICKKLVKDDKLVNESQAAYGMIIDFDTYSFKDHDKHEQIFVNNLREIAEKSDCRFITGVYTVGSLIRALSKNGMHDIAYKMMTDERCPSFKYMMDDGSGTIWERWDTHMKELPELYEKPRWQIQNKAHTIITENGYEDISMNSFNHIEYTTVTPWITEYAFGLKLNDGTSGMKNYTFKPESIAENKYAKGIFETIRGPIKICWKTDNENYFVKISIPANTSCTIIAPNGFYLGKIDGKEFSNKIKSSGEIKLNSGEYSIEAYKK